MTAALVFAWLIAASAGGVAIAAIFALGRAERERDELWDKLYGPPRHRVAKGRQ